MQLLVLAPVFPPRGGPGAIRYAHFCHHWARTGHRVDVVTSAVGWHDDPGLLELLNVPGLEVHRVSPIGSGERTRVQRARDWLKDPTIRSRGLRALSRVLKGLRDRWVVPDAHVYHLPAWLRQLEALVAERNYDALVTTSYPYSAHLAGAYLTERHATLPWMMELRDPWAGTNFRGRGNGLAASIDGVLEKFCLSRAKGVSVISDQMAELYRRRYPGVNVFVTPNGYVERPPLAPLPTRPPYKFCYTGSFDHNVSPATPILRSLDDLLGQGTEVEFHWAGTADLRSAEVLGEFARRWPDVLKSYGQVPFGEVHELWEHCHVLVLTLADGAPVLTTKAFEYLNCGRPVIAFVGEGELKSLLGRFSQVATTPPASRADVETLLAQPTTRGNIDEFSYRALAQSMIAQLEVLR